MNHDHWRTIADAITSFLMHSMSNKIHVYMKIPACKLYVNCIALGITEFKIGDKV